MLIIGESLNATISSVGKAVLGRDQAFIATLARTQVECGAQMLDVNAGGLAGRDEREDLTWMVQVVQDTVEVPLVLDSSNPGALAAAIAVYKGQRPIISSAMFEPEALGALLLLAVERDCGLIALCMDETGIKNDPKERLAVAQAIFEQASAAGLKPEDLYLDPCVMTMSADYRAGAVALATLGLIRDHLSGVRTVCGMSNLSHGMPERRLLNHTFAGMLTALGLDAFLVDVRDQKLMATLQAAMAIAGQDEWCREYFKAHRAGRLQTN